MELEMARLFGKNNRGLSIYDVGRNILIDASDNVIVNGSAYFGFIGDFYTAKYAKANGTLLYEKHYNGVPTSGEISGKIAFTPDGGLVVFGTTEGFLATVKYLPFPATEPAILTSPASASAFMNTIPFNYRLPDAAANGSLKLTFQASRRLC
jgi:hypothetical protein